MDFIPPSLVTGGGVITMFALSWWWLMRGSLHTDTEFQAMVKQRDEWKAIATEAMEQKRILVESQTGFLHVIEGFKNAAEDKR